MIVTLYDIIGLDIEKVIGGNNYGLLINFYFYGDFCLVCVVVVVDARGGSQGKCAECCKKDIISFHATNIIKKNKMFLKGQKNITGAI